MQKSIFLKYFSVCFSLIFVSITILGAVFLFFASQYFKEDKYRMLESNIERSADLLAQQYNNSVVEGNNSSDEGLMDYFLKAMAQSIDCTFFITDKKGKIVYSTQEYPYNHIGESVGSIVIDKINKNKKYSEFGSLTGIYDEKYYTVAKPVIVDENVTIAYIFSSYHAVKQQRKFLTQLFKIYLFSSFGVLIITFIASYIVSVRMVRPLKQMAIAAQKFGKGEFNLRVRVTRNDEMGQLANALNDMARSLSTLENARRSFTANISHELKTPMTSIAGFIDGILDGTIPQDKQKYYLQIVSDEIKRLSRLVKTMLNLSRIEAGEMKINANRFNIVDSICQTVFSFEQQIEKKNISIKGLDHEKVLVEADPDLIHQVIYNLTENAVKFVDEGGYIEFGIHTINDRTYISVKNSGAGLSKEELPKIFDRFYKTDKSRGLDKNGVGLGLYIVRSIVNLHGGEVNVKSVEGEYVEITFSVEACNQNKKFKKN